jgi:hypothetical protein
MTHFVFVDFENVPTVDLALIEGRAVHVALLLGKNQARLDLSLVHQIHRMSQQVELIEVGASGRNALDLTLASYLGRTIERKPDASFAIVSKDKDFDAMIAHWREKGVTVVRETSLAALPFLEPPKPPTAGKGKPPVAKPTPAKPQPATKPDKFAKFVSHVRNSPPSSRTKLEHMITAFFQPTLPVGGMKGLIRRLEQEKVVVIDADGKVKVE